MSHYYDVMIGLVTKHIGNGFTQENTIYLVGNGPRLLTALVNHHLEPHKVLVAKVLVEKTSTSN